MKFNTNTPSNKTVNLAGGTAFSMKPELELISGVLTTFLKDEYYESSSDRMARLKQLIAKCDPKFVANLAVFARKEFHLRSVSHLLLAELSFIKNKRSVSPLLLAELPFIKNKDTVDAEIVRNAIIDSAERVDDLTEIVSYCLSKYGKLPKQVKRGVRRALFKFNRYQLAKYKAEGKSVSLVDLFNLVHPNPNFATDEQKLAWKDLIEGNLKQEETWENELSAGAGKEGLEKLILEGKMGYMALLRNLNNLIKYGVGENVIDAVVAKLTNPHEIAKSKQLPFRFYTAYVNVKGNRKLTDAVAQAMEIAVHNAPELEGKTLIALDVSGSMSSHLDKAGILAAALFKKNKNADIVMYDTQLHNPTINSNTPIVDFLTNRYGGGGTETSLVFTCPIAYDRIVIISDNESWAESWRGQSVNQAYEAYKARTGADPWVYAIDVAGYGTRDIKAPKVRNIDGFSEKILDLIKWSERGDMITLINEYR